MSISTPTTGDIFRVTLRHSLIDTPTTNWESVWFARCDTPYTTYTTHWDAYCTALATGLAEFFTDKVTTDGARVTTIPSGELYNATVSVAGTRESTGSQMLALEAVLNVHLLSGLARRATRPIRGALLESDVSANGGEWGLDAATSWDGLATNCGTEWNSILYPNSDTPLVRYTFSSGHTEVVSGVAVVGVSIRQTTKRWYNRSGT